MHVTFLYVIDLYKRSSRKNSNLIRIENTKTPWALASRNEIAVILMKYVIYLPHYFTSQRDLELNILSWWQFILIDFLFRPRLKVTVPLQRGGKKI